MSELVHEALEIEATAHALEQGAAQDMDLWLRMAISKVCGESASSEI
jgi:hypothetical protein